MPKGLWFVLFIIAIQIISAVLQHRKKEQERKAREEAMRQRALAQSDGGATTPPTMGKPIGAPTAPAPVAGDSAAELEARRRAQLEQLRQRRESRRGNVVDAQLNLPSASTRRGMPIATQLPTRPPASRLPTVITSERAMEQARRSREMQRRAREQQERVAAAQQQAEDDAAHLAYEARFHAVAGEEDAASHGVPSAMPAVAAALGQRGGADRAGVTAAGLLSRLREPASVREIVLLREIVDRPVALRGAGG